MLLFIHASIVSQIDTMSSSGKLIFKEVLTITKNNLQGEGSFIYKKNPGPKAPGFIFTVRLSGYKLLRS
jgi:hypothetical protein